MIHWPKIPLGFRLFLPYFALVLLTAYFVGTTVLKEIKPAVRKTTEETLIDTANLLAVLVTQELKNNRLSASDIAKLLKRYGQTSQGKSLRSQADHQRIYVTDAKGIVLIDTLNKDVGSDFSRWNDVYLTLRGKYGARSTPLDINDPLSSVMYVAAPIYDGDNIIGSLTVAKANRSFQHLIESAKQKVLKWLIVISLLALLIGAGITWRINRALDNLSQFANRLGQGKKATKPLFRIFYEYQQLGDALEQMQQKLDGKNYIEQYVQTLTHELKSPLAAIRGASEILQGPINQSQQQKFSHNIENESKRMQDLIDRLLNLTRIEQQQQLTDTKPVQLIALLSKITQSLSARFSQQKIHFIAPEQAQIWVNGDAFLLQQALYNLLDNALDFTPENGQISVLIQQDEQNTQLTVHNQGEPIPEYALARVCERFYSLARPNTGKKSTGLGLNFVEQVAQLHTGELHISNQDNGVSVTLNIKNST